MKIEIAIRKVATGRRLRDERDKMARFTHSAVVVSTQILQGRDNQSKKYYYI